MSTITSRLTKGTSLRRIQIIRKLFFCDSTIINNNSSKSTSNSRKKRKSIGEPRLYLELSNRNFKIWSQMEVWKRVSKNNNNSARIARLYAYQ